MKEKNIYIIRHGETKYNKLIYLQGSSIDSSLNSTGIEQSKAFYNSYKDVKFDKIYTSSLKRSIESVQLFIAAGVKNEQYDELNEINWGVLEGRPLKDEAKQTIYSLIEKWRNGQINEKIPGGESPVDVAERQKRVLNKIFTREDEKNILISTHGRAIRVLICQLLNKPLTQMEDYDHDNLGLYLLHYGNNNSTPLIKKHNCAAHLIDLD